MSLLLIHGEIQAPDELERRTSEVLERIARELQRSSREIATMDDQVRFSFNIRRSLKKWITFRSDEPYGPVLLDSGTIRVRNEDGKCTLQYSLNLKNSVFFVTAMLFLIVLPVLVNAPNISDRSAVALSVGAWPVLVLGNCWSEKRQFEKLLRRILAETARAQ